MELHDYQHVAVDHLHRHRKGALFLDMGLGKTAVVLRALTPDHLPVLVTAPKRVTENVWAHETKLWRPDLRISIAEGTPDQREASLRSGADIVAIGRDNLQQAVPHASNFNTFVMDELTSFKSRGANRSKAARRIVNTDPRYVWGLSGRPAPNGLLDLWSQVYLLDGGQRLGRTLTEYRSRYFSPGRQLPNGVIIEWLIRPGADKRIHALLDDICISMGTEGRIVLPPTTYNQVEVPLAAQARRIYKEMKKTLVADLGTLGLPLKDVITSQAAGTLTAKLGQITAGFIYKDDADLYEFKDSYVVLHHEKVRAVQEIVDGTGSPILVFYRYRAELAMLQEAFPSASTMDATDAVERWNKGQIPIMLAHPASAGHGLNLQYGGHTIVWTSLPWSLEEWEQANKRLARQGQKNPVVIHMLMSPRTVDYVDLVRLEGKASVQDALLDHLESPL